MSDDTTPDPTDFHPGGVTPHTILGTVGDLSPRYNTLSLHRPSSLGKHRPFLTGMYKTMTCYGFI